MHPIHPLNEMTVSPYVGMPVCAVMHDGRKIVGIVASVGGGQVTINPYNQAVIAGSRSKKKRRAGKARVSAFLAAVVLALAAVAALFVLPGFGYGYGYGYDGGVPPHQPLVLSRPYI
ncbi:hypothetical protein DNH61_25045 [Paenibacillus sambharensis]|uniref:Uncharacterized protein n=1 Tax=Paenibacillus sambharensis TaxID=1803190 RepID=A0A2W1LDB4_9BACL|nr:hypothetical protein [Paenibacillus sambharensis]PZD93052.1 hypothetical protein DNH61_25045 [Paenibacillus sambharensis]